MKADPLTDCPACENRDLRRVIGLGAGIIFKGSGFYQTDYRKESKPAENGGESPSKKEPNGKPETPSPAKSETGTPPSSSKN